MSESFNEKCLCVWKIAVSTVIIWFCGVCTFCQCLCRLDTIYHSALRFVKNCKKVKKQQLKPTELSRHFLPYECSQWYLIFIHESILHVLPLFVYLDRQKTIEVASAGVPQIPFC